MKTVTNTPIPLATCGPEHTFAYWLSASASGVEVCVGAEGTIDPSLLRTRLIPWDEWETADEREVVRDLLKTLPIYEG